MKFKSLEYIDTFNLYVLELVSSLSVLLLALGLISSMANVLLDGAVLQRSSFMSAAWAWIQCAAIDLSVSGTIIRAFRSYREGDTLKTWLYGILSLLLLFVACIVSNIESVQTTLNITLEQAYTHVFIPVDFLIWIRSIVIILLLVAHAAKYAQIGKTTVQQPEPQPEQKVQVEITPELVTAIVTAMQQQTSVQVIEEPLETKQLAAETPETQQISEPKEDPKPLESLLQELGSLLPNIPFQEITAVITAYRANVSRRDMCSHLKWGGAKYTTIVKPVLDTYEQLQQKA
jgi:hypothetical protein